MITANRSPDSSLLSLRSSPYLAVRAGRPAAIRTKDATGQISRSPSITRRMEAGTATIPHGARRYLILVNIRPRELGSAPSTAMSSPVPRNRSNRVIDVTESLTRMREGGASTKLRRDQRTLHPRDEPFLSF